MSKCYRFENFSIFILSILLYIFNTLIFSHLNNSEIHYFFTCYFNDLLAPLLLFSYINLVLSLREKKIYALKYLIIIIIACSFVWEYLILFFKPTSVSDPVDVVFYVLGTIIYWLIHEKIYPKNIKNKE
jgi:hypothetical protein